REQQVLRRDELVLELAHLLLGAVEDARERRRSRRLLGGALGRRLLAQGGLGLGTQLFGVGNELAWEVLSEERQQQVLGVDLGAPATASVLLRGRNRLLALDRQLVEVHRVLISCAFFGS